MQDVYRTKDIAEAATLLVKKLKLLRMEQEGRIFTFVFEDKNKCEDITNQFWFGECLVNAKVFYQTMNVLKNKIFSKEKRK